MKFEVCDLMRIGGEADERARGEGGGVVALVGSERERAGKRGVVPNKCQTGAGVCGWLRSGGTRMLLSPAPHTDMRIANGISALDFAAS